MWDLNYKHLHILFTMQVALFGMFSPSCFSRRFSLWFNAIHYSYIAAIRVSRLPTLPQFDGVRLRPENFPRIQWAIFVASRSRGPNFVFHWSAAWPSWQPLWWGEKSFPNFRSLNLGLYFYVDFPSSSELIGYVDLTDSYEICPKCSLVINAQKCVRLFWYSKYFPFYALSNYDYPQIFNSPTSNKIFSATNRNIEKASHTFVVYHLLIDIV